MKTITLFLSIALLITACVKSGPEKQSETVSSSSNNSDMVTILSDPDWIAMLNLVNNTIDVYDPDDANWNDAGSKLMSWKPTTARGYSTAEVNAWGDVMDVKLRTLNGVDVWVTYAGGLVTTVTKSTGNKRWARIIGVSMAAHAVEVLPNGCVAVAGKNDNKVYLYSTTTSNYASFNLNVARATLWDPLLNRLWVTGKIGTTHVMTALIVGGTAASPTLSEDVSRRVTLPGCCGHDISPFYGDTNKLLVAEDKNYSFNKTTKVFTPLPSAIHNSMHVKSIGNLTNGQIVVLRADSFATPRPVPSCENFNSWSSCYAYFYSATGALVASRYVSNNCFYKARVWNPNYQ
uniref:hypothetical protein n=1 Tax=Pedobacter schmidteae TaxID=2201271 RepID=UPI000EABBB39|nr:hypothetical protein [Pedobacter schmidteae]